MDDEELDDFFLGAIERTHPQPEPKPTTVSTLPKHQANGTEVDLGAFVPEPEAEPLLEPPVDPEKQLRALQTKFPEADLRYLRRIIQSSQHHVWAMLKDKTDLRVDHLIHRFLRQRGVVTSHERHEVKGHGVDWTYLRDTGLVINRASSTEAGGYYYELCLETFDFNRGTRASLTSKERQKLLTLSNHQCNRCVSHRDLQADHRIGVAIGGKLAGAQLEDFQTLCRSCNLNKRVACEQCQNHSQLDVEMCRSCSWAYPKDHRHTAGEPGTMVTLRVIPGGSDATLALLRKHNLLAEVP